MLILSPKQEWFGNIRGDILAGIVVALALIPEAIAFSIIAGDNPKGPMICLRTSFLQLSKSSSTLCDLSS
jgi:MFS superfamily sulfate permease-like transporter